MLHDAWRAEADARIARHRMADAVWRLRTPDGRPVAGPVEVELDQPDFRLGCCLGGILRDAGPDADRWRAWIDGRIDIAVSENAMKWYSLGAQPGRFAAEAAEAELAWCAQRGIPMRGHCLLWSKEKFVQPWVRELPPERLREALSAHLRATVERFAGRVACFDSLNEMLDGDFYQRRLGEGIFAELHREMNRLAPGLPLFVNEYGILDSDEKLGRYLALVGQLRAAGVRLGGIGVQEHAAERFIPLSRRVVDDNPERQGMAPLVPAEVWRRLDQLAATGLPVHITEVSFRTLDDEAKADALEAFVLTALAHPAVECFLIWGFWERAHWLGRSAAFIDKDWNELAPARRWDELRRRLRTRARLEPDAEGRVRLRGFTGGYAVRAGGLAGRARLPRGGSGAGDDVILT